MPTTLVVTNDFPPRIGGIESFVADVCTLLDDDVVVLASAAPGAREWDRRLPYPVVRTSWPMLPSPRTTRTALRLLRSSGVTRVIFGAAAPLGLMAWDLRRAGAHRILGLSHGHETWWASVPGTRSLLRRIGDSVDHLGTISNYAARRIAPALSAAARQRLIRLPPPVDLGLFTPRTDTAPHPPRCIAAGRFVAQKGFRCLLRAWYLMMTQWPASAPQPELVLVGDGPERRRLEAMVAALPQPSTVRFTGPLARSAVVAQLQASDVFALPVRTRLYGLNPEGLGLGFLEAAACGLAVIAGRSGGAPETVLDGRSGYVVHPDDVSTIAHRLTQLLSDRSSSRRMGEVGRMHISARYGSSAVRRTLRTALEL